MTDKEFLDIQKEKTYQKVSDGAGWGALWEAIWKKALQNERRKARHDFNVDKLTDKTFFKVQLNILKEAEDYSIKSGEIVYKYRREL